MAFKDGLIYKVGLKTLHWANKNTPEILTGLAVVGVVVTAVSAVRSYKKTQEVLKDIPEDAPLKDKVLEVAPHWIGTTFVGGITVAEIFGIHKSHSARELAMVTSFNMFKESADLFKEYAVEEIGKNKVKKIEHEVHDEILKKYEPSDEIKEMCDAENGGAVFFDRYSGQFILTTYEKVYRAAEKVNRELRPYGKGGRDWYSWADFIVDCGGEYSEACEKWGFVAKPFGDAIESPNDICDPHIQEYKGHRCTVVYIEPGYLDDKNFL